MFQFIVRRFMSTQKISGVDFGKVSSMFSELAVSYGYLQSSGGLYRVHRTISNLSTDIEQATQHSGISMSSSRETGVFFAAIREPPSVK